MIRNKAVQQPQFKINWRAIIYGLLVIIALGLIFNQPLKRLLIHSYQPTISRQAIKKAQQKKATYEFNQVKELTLGNVAAARAQAKSIPIIGEISIPSDGINLPIAKGISNANLAFAAGTFRPDMKMGRGNYALAGHNMDNLGRNVLFSPLYYKAKVGQQIYLTDLKKVYVYRITQKKFVSKYRVDLVKNTRQKMITLITCDATGTNRLMVRGKFIKAMKYKQAPQKVRQALSHKFTNGK